MNRAWATIDSIGGTTKIPIRETLFCLFEEILAVFVGPCRSSVLGREEEDVSHILIYTRGKFWDFDENSIRAISIYYEKNYSFVCFKCAIDKYVY